MSKLLITQNNNTNPGHRSQAPARLGASQNDARMNWLHVNVAVFYGDDSVTADYTPCVKNASKLSASFAVFGIFAHTTVFLVNL